MTYDDDKDDAVDVEYVLWDAGGEYAFTVTTVPADLCVTIQYRERNHETKGPLLREQPSLEFVIGGHKHARQLGELLIKAAQHMKEEEEKHR